MTFLVAVMLFAFSYKKSHSLITPTESANNKLILIDIGHGGSDPGAIGTDGTKEKEMVLSIARYIKELNKTNGFKIEFTRENDILPELKSRTTSGDEQPALFLSLHINSSPDNSKTGIEVYVPNPGHRFSRESQQLGTALLNQLESFYTVENKLLQRSKSVWVLENSNCPSALLEVGYITNNNDLRFFNNSENQEMVAQKILDAISSYLHMDIDKNNSININTDTSGKPEPALKKEVKKLSSGTIVSSDSIIYQSSSSGNIDLTPKPILIINGERAFESNMKNKLINADKVIVYSPGDKEAIRLYGTGARNGVMVFYNAKITNAEIKEADKPETDKIFDKVEIEAAFPGGMDAWRKYLERNLNAQIPILKKAPSETYTVIIQFIVNLDGSVSDARALTKHGYGMEEEAIRAIEKGPKWLPAIQNGRQVVAYRKQPITFTTKQAQPNTSTEKSDKSTKFRGFITERTESQPGSTPLFPGGDSAWKKYLAANANGTVATTNGAPEGQYKTRVQFIVHPDGHISDITALTQFGYGMEEEAIRVIKNSPKWIPATRDGNRVSSYKEQAITFTITDEPDRPDYPPVIPEKQPSHILTVKELKNIDVFRLLQLPAKTEIISFVFTIDGDRDAIEVTNTGSQINQKTRELLNNAIAGKMITVDMIRIRAWDEQKKEFYIKKIPSAVWYVKD